MLDNDMKAFYEAKDMEGILMHKHFFEIVIIKLRLF